MGLFVAILICLIIIVSAYIVVSGQTPYPGKAGGGSNAGTGNAGGSGTGGTGGGGGTSVGSCSQNSDCSSGLKCILGKCVIPSNPDASPCRADSDCGGGMSCVSGVCKDTKFPALLSASQTAVSNMVGTINTLGSTFSTMDSTLQSFITAIRTTNITLPNEYTVLATALRDGENATAQFWAAAAKDGCDPRSAPNKPAPSCGIYADLNNVTVADPARVIAVTGEFPYIKTMASSANAAAVAVSNAAYNMINWIYHTNLTLGVPLMTNTDFASVNTALSNSMGSINQITAIVPKYISSAEQSIIDLRVHLTGTA